LVNWGKHMKFLGIAFLMVGVSALAVAADTYAAPEINAASAGSAIALLTGAFLVLRGRRKK
jgi:hypothetical protein